MARREWKWTGKQFDKLNKVQEVLTELHDYKPLTLRQIYYQLVGKGCIENTVSQYNMLSKLIKWARIDGHISWGDIEDRVRVYHDLTGWANSQDFVQYDLSQFLEGYRRDLLQSQDEYTEVWIEKDALSSIFIRIAYRFTIPVVVCRGFSSISFLHAFKERLDYHANKQPIMLYFGDFDPSGVEMLDAMKTTLRDELDVWGVEFKRVALLREDIFTYNLPHNPNALKKSDTRARRHVENYGELAVELDALRPDILEEKIENAIFSELDVDLFNRELESFRKELDKLNDLKDKVQTFVSTEQSQIFRHY